MKEDEIKDLFELWRPQHQNWKESNAGVHYLKGDSQGFAILRSKRHPPQQHFSNPV